MTPLAAMDAAAPSLLPSYHFARPTTPRELFALPRLPIPRRWISADGAPPTWSAALAFTPTHLAFVAELERSGAEAGAPDPGAALHSTRFVEGLWRETVAELFLCHPERAQYLEIHLATRGRWWLAEFESPRRRTDVNFAEVAVETLSDNDATEWPSLLLIPRTQLPARFDNPLRLRGNVAAMHHSATPNYYSFAAPQTEKPDFHRVDLFLPLQQLSPAA